uniref:Uncharacterized protein n=1 Tax=Cannabis sativa TaxID=3483 RepID=A0A803NPP1_CANSA
MVLTRRSSSIEPCDPMAMDPNVQAPADSGLDNTNTQLPPRNNSTVRAKNGGNLPNKLGAKGWKPNCPSRTLAKEKVLISQAEDMNTGWRNVRLTMYNRPNRMDHLMPGLRIKPSVD